MKIQQMAFVLVAIMIFFGMVAVAYFSFKLRGLEGKAQDIKSDEARKLVGKISSLPEFMWSSCDNCIDADKALILKERRAYQGLWEADYLKIDIIYPSKPDVECTRSNYPNCRTITLINSSESFGIASSAFVSLCRKASEGGQIYDKCILGKVYASGEGIGDG